MIITHSQCPYPLPHPLSWSPKFPCVASVDLTLPAPPSLDFALRIPGVPFDLISTPFIGDAIKRIVDAVLSRMLLYPQTLHVPLFDRSYQPPVGELRQWWFNGRTGGVWCL